jgi:ribosome biogenesis GTPase
MNKEGVVIKSTGSWYQVRDRAGGIHPCRITGKHRLGNYRITNPVGVGDEVLFTLEQDGAGLIREIRPRRNYVVRQSPRQKHQVHFLAVNIDQALLVMTIIEPNLKQGFIDRFLLMTEPYEIPTLVLLNKCDLYGDDEWELVEALKAMYQPLGYEIFAVSAISAEGLEDVRDRLRDRRSLIAGQSGVGKTTLINALEPGMELRTTQLSHASGKGQHTTTFAEMYPLSFGGELIDTPGIKTLSFNHLTIQDVAHNFREIFQYSSDCRFGDCTHRNEPGCAVKDAVDNHDISALRYMNYLQILDEIENQKYWELREDV